VGQSDDKKRGEYVCAHTRKRIRAEAEIVDKNAVMIEYIKRCPEIGKMCFISAEVKDGVQSFVPISNDRQITKYIDGSVLKYYDFALFEFTGGNADPLPDNGAEKHENVQNYQKLQSIIDWIKERREAWDFPDFGEDYRVGDMYSLSDNPTLAGIEKEKIFRYMVQIRTEYIQGEN
jgi:hypothetical protein